MKNKATATTALSLLAISLLLVSAVSPASGRPDSFGTDRKSSKGKAAGSDNGLGGFFGSGGGFGDIPGLGNGWGNGISGGYGAGYGGPGGGYSKGGVIRPTVVCKEKGPCYKKKLTCPAKCFTSFSHSGQGYGGGGGGGGCTMDCKKKCIAYC
ncbi:hypothetical protein BT93_E2324 [Corymbia citriodora subsp. variegata]|nr:hypothetical protein BT93_E2324 [Corymbia citriodora subsp. variegata]